MSNSLATTGGNTLQITQQYPAERFNLLVPMQTVAEIADIHKPVMNAVQISTNLDDGEIYVQEKAKSAWTDRNGNPHPATPAKYALTKKGLNKLMRAAGIKILGTRPIIPSTCQKCAEVNRSIGRPVNCGACGNKDVKFEARISVPQLTGESIEIVAHKEIIVQDVTDGMSEAQRKEFILLGEELAQRYKLTTPIPVKVDDGGVGGGVVDRLRQVKRGDPERFWWLEIYPVKFGQRIKHKYYHDSTTYMMSVVKNLLQPYDEEGNRKPVELILPDDDDLVAQLSGRKYGLTEASKIKIESKDAVKKRGQPSPDEADCVLLLCLPVKPPKKRGVKKLATVFTERLGEFLPEYIGYYIAQTDRGLKLTQVSKRTLAWVKSWSKDLGEIMQLNSHKEIERILEKGLAEGSGITEFTRAILDSGIRDEYYKARCVAVTEVLRAHSVAQQEAYMQSPAVSEKMWKHTGEYRNEPRQNHVDMDGQRVPVGEPFELIGADGGTYEPMYPRDTTLPPEESINCHCISQPVVSEEILGLPLEERQRLQQEAIDAMDDEWEKELDAQNKAKAGIDEE